MSVRPLCHRSARAPTNQTTDKTRKIAVIGAGISGLTVARMLKQRGYEQVIVFEKDGAAGGKIHSVQANGRFYETGALVANHNFKHITATAKTLGESMTRTPDAFLVDHAGKVLSYSQFIKQEIGWGKFLSSAAKLLQIATIRSPLAKPGFAHIHPSFYLPMGEFARLHHFASAAHVIQPFLTGCGYGYYENVPAMYLMKLAPWVLQQPFLDRLSHGHSRGWSTFDQGWQHLIGQMAQGLDVRLNSTVSSISRCARHDRGGVNITADGATYQVDATVITTSPEDLLNFLDISTHEATLFSKVRYIRYVITLVRGANLPTAHFLSHINPESIGHINCIVRQHEQTDIFQIYQMLPAHVTLDQALEVAHLDIKRINGTITQVLAQREWRYFPHVGREDLERGFYRDLERLQGSLHTYFAGSLLSFETVEHNAAYAEAMVSRFF